MYPRHRTENFYASSGLATHEGESIHSFQRDTLFVTGAKDSPNSEWIVSYSSTNGAEARITSTQSATNVSENDNLPKPAPCDIDLRKDTFESYKISRILISRLLSSLPPRFERVLRLRFGIGMHTDHTLEEVGQYFKVTRERIRQIEAKALRKLRHPSRSGKLKTFMDSGNGQN
jgi:RNA polymerase sigma factor (sigma-70 family)